MPDSCSSFAVFKSKSLGLCLLFSLTGIEARVCKRQSKGRVGTCPMPTLTCSLYTLQLAIGHLFTGRYMSRQREVLEGIKTLIAFHTIEPGGACPSTSVRTTFYWTPNPLQI